MKMKVAVRSLVEYVFRSGSIDARFRSSNTLTEGTRLHQKVQKKYEETAEVEYLLKEDLHCEGISFSVEGRCDGVLYPAGKVVIDEIKSTRRDLHTIEENDYPVHWAQGKFYAYMYAKQNQLDGLNVQLTYIHVDSEEIKQFQVHYSFSELCNFVQEVVRKYVPFAHWKLTHIEERQKSIQTLSFPFSSFRKNQRQLAGAVFKVVKEGKNLFANAPTGTGKTISTLFPTVKAMGEGHIERFFYLTAKTITRTTAEETLALLEAEGLKSKIVTITAKDKMCFKEKTLCHKEYCEFAADYYDKINEAILDILANEQALTRSVIEQYALKHRVCPFEFSLDLAYSADGIICDYNYIFDPRASLKRLWEEQKKSTTLLVDEAHNLVDRGREMFSASLRKSVFLDLRRSYQHQNKPLANTAKEINTYFISIRKQCENRGTYLRKEKDEALYELLLKFRTEAERVLPFYSEETAYGMLLETYFEVTRFLRIFELSEKGHVFYAEDQRKEVVVKLFCLDPSTSLASVRKGFKSTVYFSATLQPSAYFLHMLGGSEEDFTLKILSPFDKDKLDVSIQSLSTRYQHRAASVKAIVNTIQKELRSKAGNYLVFFPSYAYMNLVWEAVPEEDSYTKILQSNRMTENEREQYLSSFVQKPTKAHIGFAVLGGVFSEGIDLTRDRLIGVMVVGVGLPMLSLERDLIMNYFNEKETNGFHYSYTYPGMNKILQAGGRLIRTEEDSGRLILMDDRFLTKTYQDLLPAEWRDFRNYSKHFEGK
ncbi:ATP-dependent DNA helicase [Bacillus sp. 2205SS5-2]|uniref:ATP-dependent DNA helicase n=1 Tax=Bacillus sp. 2205SS5-2 TaxID=3109031 RepID=UPI0030040CEE